MFWLRVSSITKLDFRPRFWMRRGRCAFKSIKRNPLLSQIATGRSRYLSSHSSRLWGLLTREWKVIMKLKLTMGWPVSQSPGQPPLSHSTFAGFTPSRISSHELDPKLGILKSVAESRIVFHIRIVRRPPPPYFRQDYIFHTEFCKTYQNGCEPVGFLTNNARLSFTTDMWNRRRSIKLFAL